MLFFSGRQHLNKYCFQWTWCYTGAISNASTTLACHVVFSELSRRGSVARKGSRQVSERWLMTPQSLSSSPEETLDYALGLKILHTWILPTTPNRATTTTLFFTVDELHLMASPKSPWSPLSNPKVTLDGKLVGLSWVSMALLYAFKLSVE